MAALWHPFADMAAASRKELELVRGEGVFVWDTDGRRYIDASSSLWYANVGHGRAEIAEAIRRQLAELETYHVFGDLSNGPARELAERLADLAPEPGSKVFLTSGGGDSIEAAVKLARLACRVRGEPGRQHIISRSNGYHGTHGIGTSILGMPYKEEFGPLVGMTSQVAWNSVDALAAEIERVGAERVAAFVFEPVIGSGGVHVPPDGYLDAVTALCRRHGIVTVADIVINGFGRLGEWLAVERFGLAPDMMAFAKGVTSGYLPLGGLIVAPGIADAFWSTSGHPFSHGGTYSGHATCCAAALANLDLLARDDLVHRARDTERPFHASLSTLASHPLVGEVRGGVGLMAAVAIDAAVLADRPDAALRLHRCAREAGVLTRGLVDGVAVAPPLTISDDERELIVQSLAGALDTLA